MSRKSKSASFSFKPAALRGNLGSFLKKAYIAVGSALKHTLRKISSLTLIGFLWTKLFPDSLEKEAVEHDLHTQAWPALKAGLIVISVAVGFFIIWGGACAS